MVQVPMVCMEVEVAEAHPIMQVEMAEMEMSLIPLMVLAVEEAAAETSAPLAEPAEVTVVEEEAVDTLVLQVQVLKD